MSLSRKVLECLFRRHLNENDIAFQSKDREARIREALAVLLRGLDKRMEDYIKLGGAAEDIDSAEKMAQRLGCEPEHESILRHFDEHHHEKGYVFKLFPQVED